MRLFIAVSFTKDVEDGLVLAQNKLREESRSGNFSARENLHLTLAFIGETDRLDDVCRIMDRSVGRELEIEISGGGRFDDIYWARVSENAALSALAKRLQKELRDAGFDIEDRPFKPHITLARGLVPINSLQYPRVSVKQMTAKISEITLMKSERVGGKLIYTPLYSVSMQKSDTHG